VTSIGSTQTPEAHDPVLHPQSEAGSQVAAGSLFAQPSQNVQPGPLTEKTTDDYIRMHRAQFPTKLHTPTLEEYKFAVLCIPKIGREYNKNP
jgi:hypothetical protein